MLHCEFSATIRMSVYTSTSGIKPTRPEQITLEAWSQGFMVGSLIIMACITVANMRSGVLLHKLILIEVDRKVPRSQPSSRPSGYANVVRESVACTRVT
jgi:hypothetical protein